MIHGGDGWNGGIYILLTTIQRLYGTGGLTSGASGSDLVSIGTACPVYGCTDSTANNYDPLATSDDGSCIILYHVMVILSVMTLKVETLQQVTG